MRTNDGIDFIARERQYQRQDAPWLPPANATWLPGHPLIPSELALQGSQVVESGLDLDHEERASPPVEGEKVDPSVRAPVDDLDFAGSFEPQVSEATVDVGGTPGVNGIQCTTTGWKDGWTGGELDLQAERVRDPLDHR